MLAVIDYGVGNLFSLVSSLRYLGFDAMLTDDTEVISRCGKLILPGVGAFRDAAAKLHASGLDEVVKSRARAGTPLLGICLGMQLLFEKSLENGCYEGLSLIEGTVGPLSGDVPEGLKIPQIGWNALTFPEDKPKSAIYKYTKQGDCVYFVHSYYASCPESVVSAYTEYGIPVTASAEYKNIYGTQYHPEKSGRTGLNILRAFCELEDAVI